ncbi:hypothetical protein FRC03_005927 [Tulasnella sp. 419]|nr:hypothetical protein FRC03_005927 [Tulasnella sp. 419]
MEHQEMAPSNGDSLILQNSSRVLEDIFTKEETDVLLDGETRFGIKSFDGTIFDEIAGDVIRDHDAVAQGALADIYTGTWIRPDQERVKVAIKVLRKVGMEEQDHPEKFKEAQLRANKRLNREVKVWQTVSHPHAVPLLGFKAGKDPWLVTPWYRNGNCRTWLGDNPGASRTRILKEVAEALVYLHTMDPVIVHCDIKANNILIDDDGHAVLGDFGVARVCMDLGIADATAPWNYGCQGFIAPECHNADDGAKEPPRDVYAFGGLIAEVYSRVPPFWHLRRAERHIIYAITVEHATSPRKEHPNVPDWAWDLALRCWTSEPESRPPMTEVLAVLNERLAQESES